MILFLHTIQYLELQYFNFNSYMESSRFGPIHFCLKPNFTLIFNKLTRKDSWLSGWAENFAENGEQFGQMERYTIFLIQTFHRTEIVLEKVAAIKIGQSDTYSILKSPRRQIGPATNSTDAHFNTVAQFVGSSAESTMQMQS